eukprot:CAMPEP_0115875042 /NCGR_PEP_ID=MMETSP0287-20121206/24877_1 /TAXON_ID=412157 /ORGANISM="Chrysochromulina rotalis, Strain UIO044" /LENGTH=178 /DNA_ID=CAMNT_0003330261 /DNA_START=62 /DNA_END=598 /DNA_ORIENTATION=-
MGTRKGMRAYLRRMADEIKRLLVPRLPQLDRENWMLAKGYDQGIHIWLLYNEFLNPAQQLAVRVLQYDNVYISGAAGMRIDRDVILRGGVLLNMRNETIAVVHQYNRMNFLVRETFACLHNGAVGLDPEYCTVCRRTWRVVPVTTVEEQVARSPLRSTWNGKEYWGSWESIRLEYVQH